MRISDGVTHEVPCFNNLCVFILTTHDYGVLANNSQHNYSLSAFTCHFKPGNFFKWVCQTFHKADIPVLPSFLLGSIMLQTVGNLGTYTKNSVNMFSNPDVPIQ